MNNDLSIDVNVNLTVTEEMAKRAVVILNMYLEDSHVEPTVTKLNHGVGFTDYYRITL